MLDLLFLLAFANPWAREGVVLHAANLLDRLLTLPPARLPPGLLGVDMFLVGVTAFMLASKYHHHVSKLLARVSILLPQARIYPLSVWNAVELEVLQALDHRLAYAGPHEFLEAHVQLHPEAEPLSGLVLFLMELALFDPAVIRLRASTLFGTCLTAAQLIFQGGASQDTGAGTMAVGILPAIRYALPQERGSMDALVRTILRHLDPHVCPHLLQCHADLGDLANVLTWAEGYAAEHLATGSAKAATSTCAADSAALLPLTPDPGRATTTITPPWTLGHRVLHLLSLVPAAAPGTTVESGPSPLEAALLAVPHTHPETVDFCLRTLRGSRTLAWVASYVYEVVAGELELGTRSLPLPPLQQMVRSVLLARDILGPDVAGGYQVGVGWTPTLPCAAC